MKKLFLLFAAGSIAMNVGAQERQISVGPSALPLNQKVSASSMRAMMEARNADLAHKSTAATSRWYNYADYVDTMVNLNATFGLTPSSTSTFAPYMWNDTTSQDAYSGGTTAYNKNVSIGTVLDPKWRGFNDDAYYADGSLKITATDAYVVDSVIIQGFYGYNTAKSAVKDTLRLSFVHGNGSARTTTDVYSDNGLSGTHWGSPNWMDLQYDSVTNKAVGLYNSHTYIDSIIHVQDTLSNGVYYKVIPVLPVLTCAANDMAGMSLTFKSGDASFTAGSVVFSSTGTYNYNMFRPIISYVGTSTTPDWPVYTATDNNTGLFKTLPSYYNGWEGQYVPEWAWSNTSTGGAADNQTPYIWMHITCAGCTSVISKSVLSVNTINSNNVVTAVPNPANNEVNISFTLVKASDITVSLTNMLGQVVASQTISNATSGKATFNTTALPAGVYAYTLQANGEHTTGRVVVAH